MLDGGWICEEGTRDELVDGEGLYASLFALQADAHRGVPDRPLRST
ncbi:hypothetical protein [Luteimicrobium album]|nr:hypothetical protein [Luteimicrobium album]